MAGSVGWCSAATWVLTPGPQHIRQSPPHMGSVLAGMLSASGLVASIGGLPTLPCGRDGGPAGEHLTTQAAC